MGTLNRLFPQPAFPERVMPEFNSTAEYRPIPDWPGYLVGSDGSLWSIRKSPVNKIWRRRPGIPDRDGYRTYEISLNGENRTFRAGVLVLLVFVGPRPEGMQACHGPLGNKDDSLGNLRWGTLSSNWQDKFRDGTATVGERHGMAKLTNETILEIRRRWAQGGLQKRELGREYGVNEGTIARIVSGKSWRHI